MTRHPDGPSIRRHPPEESCDLYPGLCVHDGRVTGSITVGPTRLPLWAILPTLVEEGWGAVQDGWPSVDDCAWSARDTATFLYRLMQMRGEFGRLLLVLADAERGDENNEAARWWANADARGRVHAQLLRCLHALQADGEV